MDAQAYHFSLSNLTARKCIKIGAVPILLQNIITQILQEEKKRKITDFFFSMNYFLFQRKILLKKPHFFMLFIFPNVSDVRIMHKNVHMFVSTTDNFSPKLQRTAHQENLSNYVLSP